MFEKLVLLFENKYQLQRVLLIGVNEIMQQNSVYITLHNSP